MRHEQLVIRVRHTVGHELETDDVGALGGIVAIEPSLVAVAGAPVAAFEFQEVSDEYLGEVARPRARPGGRLAIGEDGRIETVTS